MVRAGWRKGPQGPEAAASCWKERLADDGTSVVKQEQERALRQQERASNGKSERNNNNNNKQAKKEQKGRCKHTNCHIIR